MDKVTVFLIENLIYMLLFNLMLKINLLMVLMEWNKCPWQN